MSVLNEWHIDLRNLLWVQDNVVDPNPIRAIRIGEEFKVRYVATNLSRGTANITFQDPKIKVEATRYAHPLHDKNEWLPFRHATLSNGQSTDVEVKFKADADLPFELDRQNKEEVGKYLVKAVIDLARLAIVTGGTTEAEIEV